MRDRPHLMRSVLGEAEDSTGAQVDAYELLDPVEILSKLPKDFYEKIVSFRSPVARRLTPVCCTARPLCEPLVFLCRKPKSGRKGKKPWMPWRRWLKTQSWKRESMGTWSVP